MTSGFRTELYDDLACKPCTDQHIADEVVQHFLGKHSKRAERAQLS